jgi:uncharacterized protein (UPF0333 family)
VGALAVVAGGEGGMSNENNAWKEMLIVFIALVVVVGLVSYFVNSCETSKHRMVTECLRLGRSSAECKLMEMP